MRPFFEQPGDVGAAHSSLKTPARLAGASLFSIPGLAVFGILLVAFLRNDAQRLFDWLRSHVMALFGGLFLLTYGLVALLRPDVVITWVGSAFPDYDLGARNRSVQYVVRGLGAFVVAFGLLILKRL